VALIASSFVAFQTATSTASSTCSQPSGTSSAAPCAGVTNSSASENCGRSMGCQSPTVFWKSISYLVSCQVEVGRETIRPESK
jgi:hypothetical protein